MSQPPGLSDLTYQVSAATWTFFSISTTIFLMRNVARVWLTEASLGWEDTCICASWALDLVRMISLQLAATTTRGVDFSNLAQTAPTSTFWALFSDSWAFLSLTMPKIGVAILLIRIFRPGPRTRTTILSSALGVFAICAIGFILCYAQCTPAQAQWAPAQYPDAKCWPRDVFTIWVLTSSSLSGLLDIAFAIYPGYCIWNLQMPTWKKISTMGFMGLGVAAFIISIVKVYVSASLLGDPTPEVLVTNALRIGLWNSIENDVVLTAACLPGIRPFFQRHRLLRSKKSTTNSHKSRSRNGPYDEHALQIVRNGQPPGSTDQSIYVRHDFSLQSERADPMDPDKLGRPSYFGV